MPNFLFHVEDGPEPLEIEVQTIAEAKCEAVRYAGKLLCDRASSFWNVADLHMWVTDERGLILFALRLLGTDAPAIQTAPVIELPPNA